MNSCTHSLSEVELSFMNDFDMMSLPELLASTPMTNLPPSNFAPLPDQNRGAKPSTPTSRSRSQNYSVEVPNATSHSVQVQVQISKQTCPKQRKRLRNNAEKKRREKLQAKFKRLRDALPNSQKLDSASLLDKAISHIKTLQCELHQIMQQMCAMNPYTFVPAYHELRFAGSTSMPPYPFVPQMRPNYAIAGIDTNHHSVEPGLGILFLPQTSATGAGSTVPAPSFRPNPYNCYDQSQLQAMPVHARNTLPNYLSEENHRGK